MYCQNCGKQIPEGGRFCPECGFATSGGPADAFAPSGRVDPSSAMMMHKKSEGLALLLSLIITGLGHIYVGKSDKGAALLIAQIICLVAGAFVLIPWIISLVLWIYGMYDSYVIAKEYNEYLLTHDGQTPW